MNDLVRFQPDLSILPTPQKRLWYELSPVPQTFTLYGGTAIALQLSHRTSVDFDFFCAESFSPDGLVKVLPFLKDGEIIQREPDTLTVRVDRDGPVLISFMGAPELGRVNPPREASENGVRVASLLDLAGTKADVVQKRAAAKDYVDIAALLSAGVSLAEALSAAIVIKGRAFNPQITLKALSYFGDGDLKDLPDTLKRQLQDAVRNTDPGALPVFPYVERKHGLPGAPA